MTESRLIVADTGPLIALSHVDALGVLPAFYGEVLVPSAVANELGFSRYEIAQTLLAKHPWIQVRDASKAPDQALHAALDRGEAAAITLAVEMGSPILIDERRGRRIALNVYHLEVRGTLGTLVRARRAGLVGPLAPLLDQLIARGDHIGRDLLVETLRAVGEAD